MQLAQRKIKILKAVVEAYIQSGDPVGSKVLCNVLDFNVSSATVRSEMAELAELGLLVQPHTSAGRIPTQEGYRLYVNSLMDRKPLAGDVKALIAEGLEISADDPEKILRRASEIVSELTGGMTIATSPSGEEARIRRLNFVQTGRQSCMVVLITSTGLVKTRLFKCDFVITPEIVRIFETILNKKLAGIPVISVTPAYVQTAAVEFGDLAMLIPSVLAAIMDACNDAANVSLAVSGKTNLLFNGENDFSSIRPLAAYLHSDDELEVLVSGLERANQIYIGSEIGVSVLESFSLASVPYNIESFSGGLITAVIPMRSDYAFVLSAMEYTAECVGEFIRNLLMLDGE